MTFRSGVVVGVAGAAVAISSFLAFRNLLSTRVAAEPGKAAPASSVTQTVKEAELNTVKLSDKAMTSLGILTAPVRRVSVRRARVYGGEITVPTGQTVLVAAPLGGILKAPESGLPTPGSAVKRGQVVLQLLPLLTPEGHTTLAAARVDAEGQVNNAGTQLRAAKLALDRAERLLREEAGSQRIVDESQATADIAARTLEAAEARFELLSKALSDTESGTSAPIAIQSPQGGLLRNLSALPDQSVPIGAALFEVVDLSTVWVRVAVPVSDLADLNSLGDVRVGSLSAKPGEETQVARPVSAPPTANALAATVDFFYSLDNSDGRFLPGQRVGVDVALQGRQKELVIAWGAIIHDIYGGAWVYESLEAQTFTRRRIVVRSVTQGVAVLDSGLEENTAVVVEGAQELFGVETGFSK